MTERGYAYLVCGVLLAAMLAPAFRDADADSFPLSTYPMFAHERARTESITSAVAVHEDGREVAVPSTYITSVEPMQSIVTLQRTVAAGPKAAATLCRAIAERVAHSADAGLAQAARVMIVTRSVDTIAFLGGQTAATGGRIHAQCKVRKAGAP